MVSLKNALNNCKSYSELKKITDGIDKNDIIITWYGSRRFKHKNFSDSVSYNDFLAAINNKTSSTKNPEELKTLFQAITILDQKADQKLHSSSWLAKRLHFIPHLLGKLFFNRKKLLENITRQIKLISDSAKLNSGKSKKSSSKSNEDDQQTPKPRVRRRMPPPKKPEGPTMPILEEIKYDEKRAKEEIDFNFLLESENLASLIVDNKLLFHIHAGRFGENSPLEGTSIQAPLNFLLQYLKDQNKALNNPRLTAFITRLEDAYALSLNLPDTGRTASTDNSFEVALQEKITNAFATQKPLLIPGGWRGAPMGHAMYYELIPTGENRATLRIYDLGATANIGQGQEITSTKVRYCPYKDIENISKIKLLDLNNLRTIREMGTNIVLPNEELTTTQYNEKDILTGLVNVFAPETAKNQETSIKENQRPMSPQEAGVCAFRSLMAFVATNLPRREYKKLKCDLKIKSLILRHNNLLARNNFDAESIALMRKSIKRTSKSVYELALQKILDKEYVKEAASTLKKISQSIPNTIENKDVSKTVQFYWNELSSWNEITIPKANLAKETQPEEGPNVTPTSHFEVTESFNKLHVEKNKLKAISEASELAEKAFKQGERLGIKIGIENLILALPTDLNFWKENTPVGKERELIVKLGQLSESYLNSCFATSDVRALNAEKNSTFAKILLIQESLVNLFNRDKPLNFSISIPTESNIQFIPQHKAYEDISRMIRYPSSKTSEIFGRIRSGKEGSIEKSYKSDSLKDFEKLFSDIPDLKEAFAKFSKGSTPTLKKYIEFYASEGLPPWFKAVRNAFFAHSYLHVGNIDSLRGGSEKLALNFSWKEEKDDAVSINLNLENLQNIDVKKPSLPRNLLMIRPLESSRLKNFLSLINDNYWLGEKDWLSRDSKQLGIDLPQEEYEEIRRLFGDSILGPLETIDYFSKNIDKLTDPDYQTIFQLALFRDHLPDALTQMPALKEKSMELISRAYHQMKQADQTQPSIFLLQMLRYMEGYTETPSSVSRFNELKIFLNRKGVTGEEKSVIYSEIVAHLNEKRTNLDAVELELLLSGLLYLSRNSTPDKWADSYQIQAVDQAPHNLAAQIKKFVSQPEFLETIHRIIQKTLPDEEQRSWSLVKNSKTPIFESNLDRYSPLDGFLYIDREKNVKQQLPDVILKDPDFIRLFENIKEANQVKPGVYSFIDTLERETLIRYDYESKAAHIEQKIGDEWRVYLPISSLIVQPAKYVSENPRSRISSRYLANNFSAWALPNGQIVLTNIKTGEAKYRVLQQPNARPKLQLERIEDNLTLGTPSALFQHFEDGSYVHEWYDPSKPQKNFYSTTYPFKELEFPRFGLSFDADLSSEQFPGFVLNPNTRLPIFNNYSRYLVLENREGEKKVIVACQNFSKPRKMNSLKPEYEVDLGLQITNYEQQKYFVFDINKKGLLSSSSREANLYLAQIFTLVQQYDLAWAHLRAYGSKLTPYTKDEIAFLNKIACMNQITGDEDSQARALRTYASYLLIKNAASTSDEPINSAHIATAKQNLQGYLTALKGVGSLKIRPEEEIFLLKVILEENFDPRLFLRLKELDPDSHAVVHNPKLSYFPTSLEKTTQISLKMPSKNDFDGKVIHLGRRPSIEQSLITRFEREIKFNFFEFYTLVKTANLEEKKWLQAAFEFNRARNNPKINFLEILFKYPDQFDDFPTVPVDKKHKIFDISSWKDKQVETALKLAEENSSVTLQKFPKELPSLRHSAKKVAETPPLIEVAFEKSVKADALDKAKDFFEASLEERDPSVFKEGSDKLNSWKNDNDAINAQLNRLSSDVERLKGVPVRTRYALKSSLKDIKMFLLPEESSPDHPKALKADLADRELKILELANRKPDKSDLEARLKFRLETMADLRKPLTLEELIINFGKQDTSYLQNRNPSLTAEDLSGLYSQIYDYLLLTTQEQRRVRALTALKKLKGVEEGDERDELIQELALELASERSFDPKEKPLYLTFEYFLNILIRKDQKINNDTFLSIPNAVMEMIMGTGKTSVLLQLIGNYHADSKNLSMLIVPEPLFEQVATPTQRIHYDAFGKELFVLSFSRKSSFSKTSLENLLDQINSATKQQQCLITTNKSIACLVLKYVEMCLAQPNDAPRSEELRLMDKLIHKLSKTGYPLMDEIDTLLNILHEVSFSFGELVPVEESEYVTISTLYKIIYKNKEIKSLAYVESDPNPIKTLNEKAEDGSNSQKNIPVLTHENYHKSVKPVLAKAFIEELAKMRFESKTLEDKVHKFYTSLKGNNRILLESYLTQDATKLNEAQKYFDALHPDLQNIIALASEEISRFLPYTLTINSNEKYGYDEDGLFAIPYSAANRPNKGSDFKNSHITINTTFQLYIKDRIPKDVLNSVISRLRTKAQLELKDEPNLDIEDTKAWKAFSKIKGDIDISLLKYNNAQLNELYEYVNSDLDLKIKFIVDGLLPYLKRYNQSAAFNPQNMVEFFTKVSGFTGTLWNTSTMSQKLKILPGLGTDAKTILTLLQKCKGSVSRVKNGSMSQMLDEMGTDFDLLVDAGGYFKDAGSAKIAKFIANKSGVPTSFYSKKGIRKMTDGTKKMPFTQQRRKVFLDQSRATGTDEKLPPTAKGVVTIGRNVLLRDLLQSVWRLRGIEKKQNVRFWVSEEVESIIRPVCGKKPEDSITFDDILKFAIFNQANQLGQDNFKALKQQLLNIPQMMVMKAIMSGKLTDQEEVEATKLLKLLWIKPANQEPRLTYGKLAQEKEAPIAVAEEIERATALIKRCFEALPSYQETPLATYLDEVKEITGKLEKLLPPKLMNKDLDDDQSVEMEVEQEVQQEVEAEMEESREHLGVGLGIKKIHRFSRITDFEDQADKNYVSLELFFKTQPKYEIYAEAFKGIDTSINVFQFPKEGYWDIDSKEKIPLSNLKFFGPYRTPLHHIGIRNDGTIMLFSHKDAEKPREDEKGPLKLYNLTLGPIDPMEISPQTFENIVKIKFLNGECNYSKEEREVLRAWIGKEEVVAEMRDFFINEVLSGFPQKKTAYNSGSDLKKIFRDLEEIEQSTLAFNEKNTDTEVS